MDIMIVICALIIGIAIGYTLANKKNESKLQEFNAIKKEMENTFKAIASDVNKSNTEEFLKLANDKFKNLTKESDTNLEQKKELIDQNLEEMNKKLESIQKQSTKLNANLESSKTETENLRNTTTKLREILSSSQQRGQWGERMVEDILKFIGLMENVNYKKQVTIESGNRPDYTFLLPKEKIINMDVKFPLTHYEKFIETKDDLVRNNEKKQFLKDVKEHIKAISTRSYIDTSSGTLDYVLMFIPNESIYSFINQEDTEVIDYALKKKVLLCSPLTLYAILSLINQATKSFAMEERASDIMKLVNKFQRQWELYVEVMDKIGKGLDSATGAYTEMWVDRKRLLEKPLKEIESLTDKIELKEQE